jgi:hypothetical protein
MTVDQRHRGSYRVRNRVEFVVFLKRSVSMKSTLARSMTGLTSALALGLMLAAGGPAHADCGDCGHDKCGDKDKDKKAAAVMTLDDATLAGGDCDGGKCDGDKGKDAASISPISDATLAHCGNCDSDKGGDKEGDKKGDKHTVMA